MCPYARLEGQLGRGCKSWLPSLPQLSAPPTICTCLAEEGGGVDNSDNRKHENMAKPVDTGPPPLQRNTGLRNMVSGEQDVGGEVDTEKNGKARLATSNCVHLKLRINGDHARNFRRQIQNNTKPFQAHFFVLNVVSITITDPTSKPAPCAPGWTKKPHLICCPQSRRIG